MRRVGTHLQLAAWIVALLPVLFAFGCTSQLYDPIVRTHPKPGGLLYYRNFDPRACQIILTPVEATNPVRTQHVLIATVLDGTGCPLPGVRVEWMLARGGVGEIVEVDESGVLPSRGYKVDNYYAVSYTNHFPQRITRGTPDPADDICLGPGQTWCVITSPIEGDTHIIAYVPAIYNWQSHKAYAVKHWVDVRWEFPEPAVNPVGTQHTFTTRLTSISTGKPVANYLVRYRILDGPPATFVTPAEVHTDSNGVASVTLAQAEPRPGTNRVSIEIIRPRDGAVIATGETSKTWVAPSVKIEKHGPAQAMVGADVEYTITVTNDGDADADQLEVVDVVPPGMEYIRSDPPAAPEGDRVRWSLGSLAAGGSTALTIVLRPTQPGRYDNCAQVLLAGRVQDESCVSTEVSSPQIQVSKEGPEVAAVGQTVTYTITVANPNPTPLTGVVVTDEIGQGMAHESGSQTVEAELGTLEPGERKQVSIDLVGTMPGTHTNRVVVTADGGVQASDQVQTTFVQPTLQIDKTGPSLRYLNRPVEYTIVVQNPTSIAIPDVVVSDLVPQELRFQEANHGGQLDGNRVVWQVGTLGPGESRQLVARFIAQQEGARVENVAVATAAYGIRVEDRHVLEIRGIAGLLLEAVDLRDPLPVGELGEYQIRVTNQGNAAANAVRIRVILPEGMELVDAQGPSQSQPSPDGTQVQFAPVNSLEPQMSLTYRIRVRAVNPGTKVLRILLEAAEPVLTGPVEEQEPTQVIQPENGSR